MIRISGICAFAVLVLAVTLYPHRAAALCRTSDPACVFHIFEGGDDGEFPEAGVVLDNSTGLIYGTTFSGFGAGDAGLEPGKRCSKSCGTVIAFDQNGVLTHHADFSSAKSGAFPTDELLIDRTGAIYGTTEYGPGTGCGGLGCGTIFQLASDGSSIINLGKFCRLPDCADGAHPRAGLIADPAKSGTFYGTATEGGSGQGWLCGSPNGCGTVYSYTLGQRSPTPLHSFCRASNCSDGSEPYGRVVLLPDGYLYGTTAFGGGPYSAGTIFRLKPDSPNPDSTYEVLYTFCPQAGCTDGAVPEAGLVADQDGNLYGTTSYGGNDCPNGIGCGVVFKLAYPYEPGDYSVIYRFVGGPDGSAPEELTLDAGRLYGNTFQGGGGPCNHAFGCGTVFTLGTDGTGYKILHAFSSATKQERHQGIHPVGRVLVNSGFVYIATHAGGDRKCNCGTLFRIQAPALPQKMAPVERRRRES